MFLTCFGGVFWVLGGVWGCFAEMFEVFWTDLGGKNGIIKLKEKHINNII